MTLRPYTQEDLWNDFLENALEVAHLAGRITLGYFQRSLDVERKTDGSPVTRADREAEQAIREHLRRVYPDHGFLGEEFGAEASDSALTWVIDPIDGTKSFIHGVPLYSNLIALMDGPDVLVGVANFPALGETVYAVAGHGCYWNGRRARVSRVSELDQACLVLSGMEGFGPGVLEALQRSTRLQRTWGDAYGYALVATGRADVMIDPVCSLWDVAPMRVLLAEAGGAITGWNKAPAETDAVATNGRLQGQVLELLGVSSTSICG